MNDTTILDLIGGEDESLQSTCYGEDNDLVLQRQNQRTHSRLPEDGPSVLRDLTIKGNELVQNESYQLLGLHSLENLSWD